VNFVDDLSAFLVDDIQLTVGLVADVDLLSIIGEVNSMRNLNAGDNLYDFICDRVHHGNGIACAIRDIDSGGSCHHGLGNKQT
jgi:hypothetical protein